MAAKIWQVGMLQRMENGAWVEEIIGDAFSSDPSKAFINVVLAFDYTKLVVDRQQELAYIAGVLKVMDRATISDLRDELRDLRGWLESRRTCYQPGGSTNDREVK